MNRFVPVVLALWSGTALADTAKAAKLLREGRALEAKDPSAAVTKLQLAATESPSDPTILAELGYAALLTRDYATAEKWTRKAISLATDDKVKAAATYNLGDILAAKGDKVGADAAHAEAKRLRGPGAGTTGGTRTFTATPLAGPFKSIEAWCATWKARKDPDRDQWSGTDACDAESDGKLLLDGHAVTTIAAGWDGDSGVHAAFRHAAIHMPDGWYIGGPYDAFSAPGGTSSSNQKIDTDPLKIVDLGGGARALAITSHMWVLDTDEKTFQQEQTTDKLALCGIGKSGKPSCVTTQIGEGHRTLDDAEPPHVAKADVWRMTPAFPGKGVLQLTADGKTKGQPDDKSLVGTHAIAFP